MSNVKEINSPAERDALGEILIAKGKLNREQVSQVLARQSGTAASFGETAIDLGLISREDLLEALSQQFGYVAAVESQRGSLSPDLLLAHDPYCATAEAIRLLRTQVALRRRQAGFRGVTVMAATPNIGCSFFSANLALAMSQIQVRTLLIDTNMRDPSIEGYFGLPARGEGLSSILSGATRPERAIHHERLPYLSVITSGPQPPNPQELLSGSLFQSLAVALMRDFDLVIADTPAANSCADAFAVAAALGQVLIVTQRNITHVRDVEVLSQQVQAAGGAVLGSVLNDRG